MPPSSSRNPLSLRSAIPAVQRRAQRRSSLCHAALAGAAACILGVSLLTAGCRQTPASSQATRVASNARTPGRPGNEDAVDTPTTNDYRLISDRDLFRPLVRAPKGAEGAEGGSGTGGSSNRGGGSKTGKSASSQTETKPADPTADIALTGITETTDGLRALIERISTGEGDFVGVGETAFGFTVEAIGPGSITLAQGDKTHEVKLGEKEMPESAEAPAAKSGGDESTSTPSSSPSASSSGRGSMPAGMPNFSNLSPDQRREAYRNWWEGMSEEQRERFRSRRRNWGGPRGRRSRGR